MSRVSKDVARMSRELDGHDWGEINTAMIGHMSGNEELAERALRRSCLRAAVCRTIFCECGSILDVRRAVYIETADGDPAGIMCCKCWEKYRGRLKPGLKAYGSTGREVKAEPTPQLRKPKPKGWGPWKEVVTPDTAITMHHRKHPDGRSQYRTNNGAWAHLTTTDAEAKANDQSIWKMSDGSEWKFRFNERPTLAQAAFMRLAQAK